ncbi:MAG: GTP 3',8-cyclase MoaA [Clostridiales bacterium]|nr:GTP 3',8-cyclase MoaA [Clostridiales bacterium]
MKDKYGRNIEYLRISLTDRCNLRCKYCMPEEGIHDKKTHGEIMTLEEIYEVVEICTELGVKKIRLTGGEPLTRLGVTSLVEKISKLDKVTDISMTTNAVLLKKYAKELKEAGLKRVNISLDTLNEKKYKEITRLGSIKDVFDGLEEAKKVGLLPIKINIVLIDRFNDDEIEDFVELTRNEDIQVRFIELMPIGQTADWARDYFVPNTIVLERIKELEPVEIGDKSSPARYYMLPGGKGKVGLINPISHQFCRNCNRLRLTADGKIKPCLHSDQEIDVLKTIREGGNVKEVMKSSILKKPLKHHLNDGEAIQRSMARIGG